MTNSFQHTIKIMFLFLVVLVAAACGPSATPTPVPEPTVDVEAAVQQTVAAQAQEATIQAISVQQTQIAAAPAAVEPKEPTAVDPNAPDAAAPGTTAVQIVADPNQAVGTPQLRVNLNANCRKGDTTAHSIVTVVSKDSVVPVVAINTTASHGTWYKVQLPNNVFCWMSAKVATPVDATLMGNIPTDPNIPPPPPTATPTATATTAATATATATTTGPTHTPAPTTTGSTHTPTPTPAVTLSAPVETPSTIVINNNSGSHICYVLTAPSGEPYGDNHLTGEMLNGGGIIIEYPNAGPYELYAQECEGYDDLYWAEYNIFNDFTWNLTSANANLP